MINKGVKITLISGVPIIGSSLVVLFFRDSFEKAVLGKVMIFGLFYTALLVLIFGVVLAVVGIQTLVAGKYPPRDWVSEYLGGRTYKSRLSIYLVGIISFVGSLGLIVCAVGLLLLIPKLSF